MGRGFSSSSSTPWRIQRWLHQQKPLPHYMCPHSSALHTGAFIGTWRLLLTSPTAFPCTPQKAELGEREARVATQCLHGFGEQA